VPLIEVSQTFAATTIPPEPGVDHHVGPRLTPGMMVHEYRIEHEIGEGGMGVVYRAIHPVIEKVVAVKVINRRFAGNPKAVSRFVMEARAVNEIGHHNIVDIFSIGELDDGRNFMVMELLDGANLHQHLGRVGRFRPGALLPVYEQVCDALDAAHAKGFLHRDLKPENIVVLRRPPQPFIKILDFGLAKLKGAVSQHTEVGAIVGTPEYMAPEQAQGHEVDVRTDVYALGIMLYELTTGCRPFQDPSPLRILAMQQRDAPMPPSHLTAMPKKLEQVILRALAKEPGDRQGGVRELMEELRRAVPEALPWPGGDATAAELSEAAAEATATVVDDLGDLDATRGQAPPRREQGETLPPDSGQGGTFAQDHARGETLPLLGLATDSEITLVAEERAHAARTQPMIRPPPEQLAQARTAVLDTEGGDGLARSYTVPEVAPIIERPAPAARGGPAPKPPQPRRLAPPARYGAHEHTHETRLPEPRSASSFWFWLGLLAIIAAAGVASWLLLRFR